LFVLADQVAVPVAVALRLALVEKPQRVWLRELVIAALQ
jgi:hypothetical protein